MQNERLKKRQVAFDSISSAMACRFCARRRASDLQCSPDLPMAFLHPPRQALCHVREKTFGQATMAFYGLFACHPLTACPTIQLLNSSEVIRQAETDPLVDGTGCEVVPCLKVLQTPCVLHWWIFFYKFHLLRCYQESLQKMCEV